MFCPNCGNQIADGAKFCPKCGMRMGGGYTPPTPPEPEPPKKPKKKKGKKKLIVLLILILIAAIVIGGAVLWFRSPARQVQSELNSGAYTEAAVTYNDGVSDNFVWRLITNPVVTGYIDQLQEDYEDGSLTYEEAVQILSVLQQFDSDTITEAAETVLEEIETVQASADLFAEAEELYEEGEYVDAIELYSEITEDSADYEAAQSRIDECEELYIAEILERTESPSTQLEYRSAINLVEIALGVFPEDEDLQARQSELTDAYYALVKSEGMTAANDAIESGDYASALDAIDDALSILGTDEDLTNLRSSTVSAYESEVTAQVSAYVEANDYDSALSLLSEALQVIPESTDLQTLYETTEENQPVKLADLTLSESDGDYELVTGQVVTTDTIGNTYGSGNLYKFGTVYSGSEPYVKYYLGGEYTTLVFTLAVSVENDGWLAESTLTVYGNNDAILYTSGGLSRTSVPVEVTVDVTGTEWLYIKAVQSSYGVTLIVSNPILYK